MAELCLVIGGARSGKSRFAEGLVAARPGPWTYIATGEALDAEMAARIAAHRAGRGRGWRTIEAPIELAAALGRVPPGEAVLVDCLTLWLANHLMAGHDLEAEAARLEAALAGRRGPLWLVSNEVGMGIVPENALARRFRDAAGQLNQRIAARADRVLLVAAGLPLALK
ncbi:bifunctional adenosylcobinamide kinase/adenosylcobinamide-phosphate guanylyltransferase [soil metagenome]